eukprot:g2174.t1
MHKSMEMDQVEHKKEESDAVDGDRSTITNNCFKAADAIRWLMERCNADSESKKRSSAWVALQEMLDRAFIVPLLTGEKTKDVNVASEGYNAWYCFEASVICLGPQMLHIKLNVKRLSVLGRRRKRSKQWRVNIIDDPAPRDGFITHVNAVFESRPTLQRDWEVVVYEHISKKNLRLCGEKAMRGDRERETSRKSSKILTYIWNAGGGSEKLFREFSSAPVMLSDCMPMRAMSFKIRGGGLRILAGQFVGVRSHKNDHLHLLQTDGRTSHHRRDMSRVFRTFSADNIVQQRYLCEMCYEIARDNRERCCNDDFLTVLGGPSFHLNPQNYLVLSKHLDDLKDISSRLKPGKNRDRVRYLIRFVEKITRLFLPMEDENPSARAENLCVIANDMTAYPSCDPFGYEPETKRIRMNAKICWTLANKSDLEIVKYFYIYSATSKAAHELVRFQRENLSNLDPNDTEELSSQFRTSKSNTDRNKMVQEKRTTSYRRRVRRDVEFIACVERDFARNLDIGHRGSNDAWRRWYTLNLPLTSGDEPTKMDKIYYELPSEHDHLIVYAIRDPGDETLVELDKQTEDGETYERKAWKSVSASDRKLVHLRDFMQDSEPTIISMRPDPYSLGSVDSAALNAAHRLLALIEKSIPSELLMWNIKHVREAKTAGEILCMLFRGEIVTYQSSTTVEDRLARSKTNSERLAHEDRDGAMLEIEEFVRKLAVITYRVDLRDIVSARDTKAKTPSARRRRQGVRRRRASSHWTRAEDITITLRECMRNPKETLEDDDETREFVNALAIRHLKAKDHARRRADSNASSTTRRLVSTATAATLSPSSERSKVNATMLRLWKNFFSKVHRMIHQVIGQEVQAPFNTSMTLKICPNHLIARLKSRASYIVRESDDLTSSWRRASIKIGSNAEDVSDSNRQSRHAELRSAVLEKIMVLHDLRGEIWNPDLKRIVRQALRCLKPRLYAACYGTGEHDDIILAAQGDDGVDDIDGLTNIGLRLMAGVPFQRDHELDAKKVVQLRVKSRDVHIMGKMRECRILQSWTTFANDLHNLKKNIWHVVDDSHHIESDAKNFDDDDDDDDDFDDVSSSTETKTSRTAATKKMKGVKNRRRRNSIKARRKSVRMIVQTHQQELARAVRDEENKLRRVVDNVTKSTRARFDAVQKILAIDFQRERIPIGVVSQGSCCSSCGKSLDMCKVCAVGPLQHGKITFNRPSWSVNFVTRSTERIARSFLEISTAKERTVRPVDAAGRTQEHLLFGLAAFLKDSFVRSGFLRDHGHCRGCFSGRDAILWLTRPELQVGSVVRVCRVSPTIPVDADDCARNFTESGGFGQINNSSWGLNRLGEYDSMSSDEDDAETYITKEEYVRGVVTGFEEGDIVTVDIGACDATDDESGRKNYSARPVYSCGSRVELIVRNNDEERKESTASSSRVRGIVHFLSDADTVTRSFAHVRLDTDDTLQPLRTFRTCDLSVGFDCGDIVRLLDGDNDRHPTNVVGVVEDTKSFVGGRANRPLEVRVVSSSLDAATGDIVESDRLLEARTNDVVPAYFAGDPVWIKKRGSQEHKHAVVVDPLYRGRTPKAPTNLKLSIVAIGGYVLVRVKDTGALKTYHPHHLSNFKCAYCGCVIRHRENHLLRGASFCDQHRSDAERELSAFNADRTAKITSQGWGDEKTRELLVAKIVQRMRDSGVEEGTDDDGNRGSTQRLHRFKSKEGCDEVYTFLKHKSALVFGTPTKESSSSKKSTVDEDYVMTLGEIVSSMRYMHRGDEAADLLIAQRENLLPDKNFESPLSMSEFYDLVQNMSAVEPEVDETAGHSSRLRKRAIRVHISRLELEHAPLHPPHMICAWCKKSPLSGCDFAYWKRKEILDNFERWCAHRMWRLAKSRSKLNAEQEAEQEQERQLLRAAMESAFRAEMEELKQLRVCAFCANEARVRMIHECGESDIREKSFGYLVPGVPGFSRRMLFWLAENAEKLVELRVRAGNIPISWMKRMKGHRSFVCWMNDRWGRRATDIWLHDRWSRARAEKRDDDVICGIINDDEVEIINRELFELDLSEIDREDECRYLPIRQENANRGILRLTVDDAERIMQSLMRLGLVEEVTNRAREFTWNSEHQLLYRFVEKDSIDRASLATCRAPLPPTDRMFYRYSIVMTIDNDYAVGASRLKTKNDNAREDEEEEGEEEGEEEEDKEEEEDADYLKSTKTSNTDLPAKLISNDSSAEAATASKRSTDKIMGESSTAVSIRVRSDIFLQRIRLVAEPPVIEVEHIATVLEDICKGIPLHAGSAFDADFKRATMFNDDNVVDTAMCASSTNSLEERAFLDFELFDESCSQEHPTMEGMLSGLPRITTSSGPALKRKTRAEVSKRLTEAVDVHDLDLFVDLVNALLPTNPTSDIEKIVSGVERNSLLHHAILRDTYGILAFLVDLGVSLEMRDHFERTPLHLAAFLGREDMVVKLLKAGADGNIASGYAKMGDDPRVQKLRKKIDNYRQLLIKHRVSDHRVASARSAEDVVDAVGASVELVYRIVQCIVFMIVVVPGYILSRPVFLLTRGISRRKAAEAKRRSTVKIAGRDVVATWKILVSLVVIPLAHVIYTVITYASFGSTAATAYFFFSPFVCLASILAAERGKEIASSIVPLFMCALKLESGSALYTERRNIQLA